jgi:ribosomal protein S21
MARVISMGVSVRQGESRDCLLCRLRRMMQMGGILREAKRHRHFRGKDYEIKQKEEH